MKCVVVAMSMIAVPVSAMIQADDPRRCVTTAEADALIVLQLPDIVRISVICRPLLPRDAFLQRETTAFRARLRSEMIDNVALADGGAARLAGMPLTEPMFINVRAQFGSVPGYRLLSNPNAQRCGALDQALSSTASDSAEKVASAVRVASDRHGDDEQSDTYPICSGPRP